jgi:very-short-patch-repair endonuclease
VRGISRVAQHRHQEAPAIANEEVIRYDPATSRVEIVDVPRKVQIPNLDDLIRRYQGGESLKKLSDETGVSRGRAGQRPAGLTGAFVAAGVKLRGRSEAELVKWSRMPRKQRRRQVAAAQAARRGSKDTEATKLARARTRFQRCLMASPAEHAVADALRVLGFSVRQQFPLGKYNLDLALDELLVAVEIEDEWSSGNYPTELFDRTKDILDRGWLVAFVVGKTLDAAHVTQQLLALADALRGDKTLHGQYWVIGSNPQKRSRGSAKLDGLPRIERLHSA